MNKLWSIHNPSPLPKEKNSFKQCWVYNWINNRGRCLEHGPNESPQIKLGPILLCLICTVVTDTTQIGHHSRSLCLSSNSQLVGFCLYRIFAQPVMCFNIDTSRLNKHPKFTSQLERHLWCHHPKPALPGRKSKANISSPGKDQQSRVQLSLGERIVETEGLFFSPRSRKRARSFYCCLPLIMCVAKNLICKYIQRSKNVFSFASR